MYFSELLVALQLRPRVALQLRPRGPCGKPHYSCNHEDHVVSRATAAAWSRDSVFQSSGRVIIASALRCSGVAVVGALRCKGVGVVGVVGGVGVVGVVGVVFAVVRVGTATLFGSMRHQSCEGCIVLGNLHLVHGLAPDENVVLGCIPVDGSARLAVPTANKMKRPHFFEQRGSDITRSELKDFTLRVSSDKRGIPLFRIEVPFQVNVIYCAVCLLGRAFRGCVATADALAS